MRLYIQYVESQRSEADKGISLNANWNKMTIKAMREYREGKTVEMGFDEL